MPTPVSSQAASVDDDDGNVDVDDEMCRRFAILDVVNMTRLNTPVCTAAKNLAMNEEGWSSEEVEIFLEENERWKPTREPAMNHQPPPDDFDLGEEEGEDPASLTHLKYTEQFRIDVMRFINATRAGDVSLCSWCERDKNYVIVTRLPAFNCPEMDFHRCRFFKRLMPGEFITLFHNSIVNYHQHASYASKEDCFCGFNAQPSPYTIDFVGNSITFGAKKLFEAAYTEVDFSNGLSLDCRDTVPNPGELVNLIGRDRFDALDEFCRTNNICNLKKYLRENQGKHALIPGLWLSLEALIVSKHLCKVFDEMVQDWDRKRKSNDNVQDKEEEKEVEEKEEEVDPLTGTEANGNKRKKSNVYVDNYSRIFQECQGDLEEFVNRMREFLNSDYGIMKMKRGELDDALGLWETRGHVYATLNLISAVEFFLTQRDRFKEYEKDDVFEVNVLEKESMDNAGAEPLTLRGSEKKVRMKFAALLDHNILIKPGNDSSPFTGMTGVVYMKERKRCPVEVHRIILKHDLIQYDEEPLPEA